MYTSYFGFKENPFSLTPDPNYLYLSRNHKEAFDHLLYGINERKGFIVITGGIGTGKTTLCRALLGSLDSSTKTALIFNVYISDMELLSTINQEFGIGAGEPGLSKKDHIDSLNRFLLETFSRGGNAVLLIDEAQNLSHTVLEQIRMLSNLETEKEKLVQIVLVGQSELRELLASPSLRQLDERIMVRYDLKPLDKTDVKGYVDHRLVVAGGKGNVRFTRGAFDAIYAYSLGNPRRINGVCDRALIIAYSKDEFTISKRMVQKAIEDMRGDVTFQPRLATRTYRRSAWLSMLLLLLIIVAGFGGWNFRKEISALISGKIIVAPTPTLPSVSEQGTDRLKGEGEYRGGGERLPGEQEITAAENKGEVTVTSTPSLPSVREQDTDRLKGEREYRGNGERLSGEQEITAAENKKVPSALPEQESQAATLFLDEQASLGGLFRLFNEQERYNSHGANKVHFGLYSCYVDPKQHIMFKKPFRVRVDGLAHHPDLGPTVVLPPPRYLLVREVTADGAIAIDAAGKERLITKDFILTHWGEEVSWVYPYENENTNLVKGMRGPDVTKLQQTLNELGYSVEPTGIFDKSTFHQVLRFQGDFALMADGIVGTRTKGLLYQMLD